MEIITRDDGVRVPIPPSVSAEGGDAIDAYVASVPLGADVAETQRNADRRFADHLEAATAAAVARAHDAEVARRLEHGLEVPAPALAAYRARHPLAPATPGNDAPAAAPAAAPIAADTVDAHGEPADTFDDAEG